ncbi:MAG: hypothetical protein GF383_08700 [Candidatus Lokiarchaeota archaeon]|nr:hypothetical protein [Candidatus Lokiarchaeota archaeon]MBD3340458.1 hypothetical protein [Candidatus Lokiarchaeota archaeon]
MIKTKSEKKKNSQILVEQEEKLKKYAKIAWERALSEYYFPPLNEPNFVFDYSRKEGFYIDPENRWQITMNLANVPLLKDKNEIINYFYVISLHEISHYQIIPYDGIINAKLLRAAMKHVNRNFASIVVNVFSDLVIDTVLFEKYSDLMKWELRKTYNHLITQNKAGKLSGFAKMLFKTYEELWNVNLIEEHLLQSIQKTKDSIQYSKRDTPNSEIMDERILSEEDLKKIKIYESMSSAESVAQKIKRIISKNFEDEITWENKVENIAKILKKPIEDSFSLIGSGAMCDKNKSKRSSSDKGGQIEVPNDVLELMDNPLENKNSDKLKKDNDDEMRQKAEEFALGVPYSEFGSPAIQAGLLKDGAQLATWYRGLAKNLIEIKIFQKKPGGEVPLSPHVWRIGDPLEELDVVQSLLSSPILVPNITTRKWTFREGAGHYEEQRIPDLLIVLDSSGSMEWHYTRKSERAKGAYHTALVASFAALHFAAKKGVKFSIINFSGMAEICPWTTDYLEAEKVLLHYQGSGTILPTKSIQQQCEKAERNMLVLIITDFGIYNWSPTKKTLLSLAERGHKIVGFFIGSSEIPKSKFKALISRVSFYPILNVKSLINLVIKEVKKYFD